PPLGERPGEARVEAAHALPGERRVSGELAPAQVVEAEQQADVGLDAGCVAPPHAEIVLALQGSAPSPDLAAQVAAAGGQVLLPGAAAELDGRQGHQP